MNRHELHIVVNRHRSNLRERIDYQRSISQSIKSRRTYNNLHFLDIRKGLVGELTQNGLTASGRALPDTHQEYEQEALGDIVEFAGREGESPKAIIIKAYPNNQFGIFVSRLRVNPDDGTTTRVFDPLYDVIRKNAQEVLGTSGDAALSVLLPESFPVQVRAAIAFTQ